MIFLGNNIRFLRKQSSKTQSEVAAVLKKGQTTIGNWENGISEPSLEELVVLSNYFGVDLDELVKTDMEAANRYAGRSGSGRAARYDHSGVEPGMAKEPGEALPYVLDAIRSIRQDIEKLYSLVPGKSASSGRTGQP